MKDIEERAKERAWGYDGARDMKEYYTYVDGYCDGAKEQERTIKEEMIDKACDVFADIINEALPINASDMPYIKKFRESMTE